MKLGRVTRICAVLVLLSLIIGACIFSPDKGNETIQADNRIKVAASPDSVVHNLKVAFDQLDVEVYRNCLNDNYFYVSRSEVDDQEIRWNKSEDVRVVENVINGSTKFVFQAVEHSRYLEYGENCPDKPQGASISPDHPDEIWTIIRYTVDMQIFTKQHGDIEVHQFMDFKFREDQNGLWSIVEWNDMTNM